MNANKVIHEARGLCWHNTATKPEGYTHAHKCYDCDTIFLSGEEKSRKRPDYTSPVAYCELRELMGEWAFDEWIANNSNT